MNFSRRMKRKLEQQQISVPPEALEMHELSARLGRWLKEQTMPRYGFTLLLTEKSQGESERADKPMVYAASVARKQAIDMFLNMTAMLEEEVSGGKQVLLEGATINALRHGMVAILNDKESVDLPALWKATHESLLDAGRVIERVGRRESQVPTDEDINRLMTEAMMVAAHALSMFEFAKAGVGSTEAERVERIKRQQQGKSVGEVIAECEQAVANAPLSREKTMFLEAIALIETLGLDAALARLRERGAPEDVIAEVRLAFSNDLKNRRGDTKTTLVNDLLEKPPSANREGLIELAKVGEFHCYDSPHATPKVVLVEALRAAGYEDLAQRAMRGEYDGDKPTVQQIEEMRVGLGPELFDTVMGKKPAGAPS